MRLQKGFGLIVQYLADEAETNSFPGVIDLIVKPFALDIFWNGNRLNDF